MKIKFKKTKGIVERSVNRIGIKTKDKYFTFEFGEGMHVWDGEDYMTVVETKYDLLEIMDKNNSAIVSTKAYAALKDDICYLDKLNMLKTFINRTADFILNESTNVKNGETNLALIHKPSGNVIFSVRNKGKLLDVDVSKIFQEAFTAYLGKVLYNLKNRVK